MTSGKAGLASGYVTTVNLDSSGTLPGDIDALVVGVHSGSDGPQPAPGAEHADQALGGRLAASLTALGVTGKAGEIAKIPTLGAAPVPLIVVVGLGDAPQEGAYDLEVLRRAAGAATRALAGSGRVAIALPAAGAEQTEAIALGGLLGAYSFTRYRTRDEGKPPVRELTVLSGAAGAEDAVRRATVIAESVRIAAFRGEIRDRLAVVLDLDIGSVSVKATTTDGLGLIGGGQGLAVMAVVTVSPLP